MKILNYLTNMNCLNTDNSCEQKYLYLVVALGPQSLLILMPLIIMFVIDKKEGAISESHLSKKKKIFIENIRRQEKAKTFNLLRQALLPNDLSQLLNTIPDSLPQLISTLDRPLPQECHTTIAAKLHSLFLTSNDSVVEKASPKMQVGVIVYILIHKSMQAEDFQVLWLIIFKNSLNWSQQQQRLLLKILQIAIDTISTTYLNQARIILNDNCKRFDTTTLHFYDFLIKKHIQQSYQRNVITNELFVKIIQHLKICFYNTSEKIQMLELLVQILYMKDETVAADWDLPHLFDILEFFIGSDCKLLVERSLLLIFNVNITRTSKIFLIHPCVQEVIWELQNQDTPIQLRDLMAQTYLSALINLDSGDLPKYISKHSQLVQKTLLYISQEMNQRKVIMESLQEVMRVMLEVEEGSRFLLRNWLIARPQLLESVRHTPFGMSLLENSSL